MNHEEPFTPPLDFIYLGSERIENGMKFYFRIFMPKPPGNTSTTQQGENHD